MKNAYKLFIIPFLIALMLVGCNKVDNDTNLTDTDPFESYNQIEANDFEESIAISSEVVGFEGACFEYNGKPIEFDYKFNASDNCEMGLQLFVNGIVQPFVVDKKEYTLFKIDCGKNEDTVFRISFEPNNGVIGETSSLIFANIFNPEIICFSSSTNNFGNNHNISQPLPWGIKMNASPKNSLNQNINSNCSSRKLTKEELKAFERKKPDGSIENKLDNSIILSANKDDSIINTTKEKSLELELYGNITGTYRISLYGDFDRIDINGSDYVDVKVEKNTKYSIIIDTKDLVNYKNVYAVAVALDNSEGLLKSASYYIENGA